MYLLDDAALLIADVLKPACVFLILVQNPWLLDLGWSIASTAIVVVRLD